MDAQGRVEAVRRPPRKSISFFVSVARYPLHVGNKSASLKFETKFHHDRGEREPRREKFGQYPAITLVVGHGRDDGKLRLGVVVREVGD